MSSTTSPPASSPPLPNEQIQTGWNDDGGQHTHPISISSSLNESAIQAHQSTGSALDMDNEEVDGNARASKSLHDSESQVDVLNAEPLETSIQAHQSSAGSDLEVEIQAESEVEVNARQSESLHEVESPVQDTQDLSIAGPSTNNEQRSSQWPTGIPHERKRRLTSTGQEHRLQRTRSGTAEGAMVERTSLPHRSASLAIRRNHSSVPGSSRATAIDITSSPLDETLGQRDSQVEEDVLSDPWWQSQEAERLVSYTGRPRGHTEAARYSRYPDIGFIQRQADEMEYLNSTRALLSTSRDSQALAGAQTRLPPWQPDSEVSSCPICKTVFSFWYRKHHCRKCGRVVCAACSPHRITIPRQFIIRPPEALESPESSPTISREHTIDLTEEDPFSVFAYFNPALGGGEEVRLCNPCVPDPNPNPLNQNPLHGAFQPNPLQPNPLRDPRTQGHRPTNSLPSTMGGSSSRPGGHGQRDGSPDRHHSVRRWLNPAPDIRVAIRPSSRVVPARKVREEDECPICKIEFLATERIEERESHIRDCISHYGSPVPNTEGPSIRGRLSSPAPHEPFQVNFKATEKDCIGEGPAIECSICLEDYEVGQGMIRLECLCKFHHKCLIGWWKRRGPATLPKECPVHKIPT
ncbi:hypothetical protein N7495_007325 [Penicillium taxi]|uniref:uncharacterized protein n=1 Tax=Penicillium taxi TaxID=168475 RepID=UPI00254593A8|nr:uncharacterized protein N7495_007325 [Penicillium taxi]KAJ5895634.1 hypothetical protein N7495_007325 [Penicillium taxi]